MIQIPSQGNDCGYAVFAELTGKSVEQLRNETAQGIEANSKNFSNAIEAQSWIRSHYPQEANSLLFNGGMLIYPMEVESPKEEGGIIIYPMEKENP